LSWRYINPGLLVAERLGRLPGRAGPDGHRRKQPADGREPDGAPIAAGDLDVALLAGAECIYTRIAPGGTLNDRILPWTVQSP